MRFSSKNEKPFQNIFSFHLLPDSAFISATEQMALPGFFPLPSYIGAWSEKWDDMSLVIQTHVSQLQSCTRLGPLKEALPTELQRCGKASLNIPLPGLGRINSKNNCLSYLKITWFNCWDVSVTADTRVFFLQTKLAQGFTPF